MGSEERGVDRRDIDLLDAKITISKLQRKQDELQSLCNLWMAASLAKSERIQELELACGRLREAVQRYRLTLGIDLDLLAG